MIAAASCRGKAGIDLRIGVRRLADTGTNFLVVPQQVADNAAAILNPLMEKLSGISDFFYGQDCVTGFSRDELDKALPPLEFAIPDVNGREAQVGSGLRIGPSAAAVLSLHMNASARCPCPLQSQTCCLQLILSPRLELCKHLLLGGTRQSLKLLSTAQAVAMPHNSKSARRVGRPATHRRPSRTLPSAQLTYPASVSYVEVQLLKNGSQLFCPNIQPGEAPLNGVSVKAASCPTIAM